MQYYQWVKCLQTRSWKYCTSQNYKISLNVRLWWHCMIRKLLETMGHRTFNNWKLPVKLHIDQMVRNRNSKARNDVVVRGSVTKNQKRKQSQCWEESWRVFFSGRLKDNVPKEIPVVSVMTLYQLLETDVVFKDVKGDRLLLHPHLKAKADWLKKATKRKVLTREVRFCVDIKIVITRRISFGIFPCVWTASLEKVVYMATNVEEYVKSNKKSKKGGAKGSVAMLKESAQLGCVSQDSYPRKSILREPRMLGAKHAIEFSKGSWHQIKNRERKGPSRGIILKCAPHERSLCAPKFQDRSHEETLNDAPAKQRGIWRKIFRSSRIRTKLRFMFLVKSKVSRRLLLQKDEKNENSKSIQERRCTWWARKNFAQKNYGQ